MADAGSGTVARSNADVSESPVLQIDAITVFFLVLGSLALTWLILSAGRYRQMLAFRRTIRVRCDDFLARGRAEGHFAYPPSWLGDERRERGIVMCAGGPSLLTQLYTNLDVIRNYHGCRLPVALFYVGREEMPRECQHFFEQRFSDLRCIDAMKVPDRPLQPPSTDLRGFELKPFSLLNAPFDELVFIDADSAPLRDPVHLFESDLYREYGNLFWPDTCLISNLVPHAGQFSDYSLSDGRQRRNLQGVNPRIFDHLRLPRPSTLERSGYETESGQILIDRRRCFDAVQLAWFMSSRPHHFRLYFYGDTEIYRLAFGVTGRHFCQIEHLSHQAGVIEQGSFFGKAMIPRDERGAAAFLHQMHRKPDPSTPCQPLTHVVEDLVVDHPRPRKLRGNSMLADIADLTHLRPIDGEIAKVEAFVRESRNAFVSNLDQVHLPPARARSWLDRRIIPW